MRSLYKTPLGGKWRREDTNGHPEQQQSVDHIEHVWDNGTTSLDYRKGRRESLWV